MFLWYHYQKHANIDTSILYRKQNISCHLGREANNSFLKDINYNKMNYKLNKSTAYGKILCPMEKYNLYINFFNWRIED